MFFTSLTILFVAIISVKAEEIVSEQSVTVQLSELSKYNIKDVTVSGLSAGAYMAVQMHVAYSSIVNGSAIFAGGPFYCAESNLIYAEERCMDTTLGIPQTEKLIALTTTDYQTGYIDDYKNMHDDKVYLYSGKDDTVVDGQVVQELQKYYSAFTSGDNIVASYNVDAEHCMPTLDYGEDCSTLTSPYIGKCGFDGAGEAFKTLYGSNLNPRTVMVSSNLMSFNQKPYFNDIYSSIGNTGYIYVPTACAKGGNCRLHVALHGCHQTIEEIGNEYAAHAGYNEWAESNNIVILYPYVKPSQALPTNPNGCWDWWAYTGVEYGVRKGIQMEFVRSLIKQVAGF